MEKFTTHTGVGVPLMRSNVDTDQIIPAVYLKRVTRTGFDDGLFNNWRTNEPDFVLNQDAYAHGTILVAGPDFGTGSSREHAVWALMDYGFKVVLSSRFADIFRGNAGKAGLLAALMDQQDIEQLWRQLTDQPGLSLTATWKTAPSPAKTTPTGSMWTTTPAGGSWKASTTSGSPFAKKPTSKPTKPTGPASNQSSNNPHVGSSSSTLQHR